MLVYIYCSYIIEGTYNYKGMYIESIKPNAIFYAKNKMSWNLESFLTNIYLYNYIIISIRKTIIKTVTKSTSY